MPKTKLAKVSLTPKGAWDSATAYEQLDLVSYDGGSWVAKKPSTGVTPRENDCWMKAAEKGEKGDQGAAGDTTETAKASYIVPRNTSSFLDFSTVASSPFCKGNAFEFIPADQIVIEETIDGGETWTVVPYSDKTKGSLLNSTQGTSIIIPKIDGKQNALCGIRVTLSSVGFNVPDETTDADRMSYWNKSNMSTLYIYRYFYFQGVYIWASGADHALLMSSEYGDLTDTGITWTQRKSNVTISGWPGPNFVLYNDLNAYGDRFGSNYQNAAQTILRFTFFSNGTYDSSYTQAVHSIGVSPSLQYSVCPEVDYLMTNHLYTYDVDRNCTFPAGLTVTGDLTVKGNIVPNSYKLIETITLTDDTTSNIIRTAKPDGTAYKFSKVIIIASAKLANGLEGNFGCSLVDSSGTTVGSNLIGPISKNQDFRLYVASLTIENGVLFGRVGNFASGTMYNYQDFTTYELINSYFFGGAAVTIDKAKLAYLNDIVRIRINQFNNRPFASGTVFKIYAVDA